MGNGPFALASDMTSPCCFARAPYFLCLETVTSSGLADAGYPDYLSCNSDRASEGPPSCVVWC